MTHCLSRPHQPRALCFFLHQNNYNGTQSMRTQCITNLGTPKTGQCTPVSGHGVSLSTATASLDSTKTRLDR